jgi:hypothetical protein
VLAEACSTLWSPLLVVIVVVPVGPLVVWVAVPVGPLRVYG